MTYFPDWAGILSAAARCTSRQPLIDSRVNVDFPAWMVDSLDREARRLGVTRQSLNKLWLADKLDEPAVAGKRQVRRGPPSTRWSFAPRRP
jgi:membrane-bound lytic murein transglycosylase B